MTSRMPSKMRSLVASFLFCMGLAVLASPAAIQKQNETETALRQAANEFVDVWNRHDMAQFKDLFTPGSQFVNVVAMYMDGREAIYDHHAPSHQNGWMRHSTMSATIRSVQVLSPSVGIVHAHWTSHMDGWLGRLRPRSGEMMLVLTREADHWRIVSAQNTDAAVPIGPLGDWVVLALVGGVLGAAAAGIKGKTFSRAILGSITGMLLMAPLVAFLYWDAPIGGAAMGFGVMGSIVGIAVALLWRGIGTLRNATS